MIEYFQKISGYIYISTDSGVTWVNKYGTGAEYWWSIASSSDGSIIYAADRNALSSSGGYIYTTHDGGDTWIVGTLLGYWISVSTNGDGSVVAAVTTSNQGSCYGTCGTTGVFF